MFKIICYKGSDKPIHFIELVLNEHLISLREQEINIKPSFLKIDNFRLVYLQMWKTETYINVRYISEINLDNKFLLHKYSKKCLLIYTYPVLQSYL